jgi:hypothetical protein
MFFVSIPYKYLNAVRRIHHSKNFTPCSGSQVKIDFACCQPFKEKLTLRDLCLPTIHIALANLISEDIPPCLSCTGIEDNSSVFTAYAI